MKPGITIPWADEDRQSGTWVINKDGKIVPHLYAAGEVPGVHGANRLGGNSISETITFGRIAGASAGKTGDRQVV